MKRISSRLRAWKFAGVVVGALAVTAFTAAPSAAASGSWGPWEPTEQGPINAPAGVVCPFPVSAVPVEQHLLLRYHYDDAGVIDGYEATGSLVGRFTNTDTGQSVVRNLSGPGTVTFGSDGSYDAVVSGNFAVFFLAGDTPANELLILSGHTVLHGSPTGEKTLVSSTGQTENLCETLA
jgi:hypothetical protein